MMADIAAVFFVLLGFHCLGGWSEVWAANVGLRRRNMSGHRIPTSVAFPVIVLQGLMLLSVAGGAMALPAAAGLLFAGVGLYDDWCGCADIDQRAVKGWRGHLGALCTGRLTSGAVKVFAGGVGALTLVSVLLPGAPVSVVRDALVVALSASVINALDVRPGRAGKVLLLSFLVLIVYRPGHGGVLFALPVLVFLLRDLSGQVMMGDSGANGWGAMMGAAAVVSSPPALRWVLLAVLIVIQVAAETVTLSRIIQNCPVLCLLDQLGT